MPAADRGRNDRGDARKNKAMTMNTLSEDVRLLSEYTELAILDAYRPALVVVAPAYQGRVMTSTPEGPDGPSLGWINRSFIESGKRGTAFDNYGGEDRFWLGPEGGQFGLWFKPGEPFDLDHWQTPAGFNTGSFSVTSQGPASVAMAARFDVTNYSGTTFHVAVKRIVNALGAVQIAERLGCALPPEAAGVGFESVNILANVGSKPWTREAGLLSIWTLGQFSPLRRGLVIVPFRPGEQPELGGMPNGEYFGPVPADRFSIRDGVVLFRCDGKFRSKLGVGPGRAKNVLGSYDPDGRLLTIVQFNLPERAAERAYVNSLWEIQDEPFRGDVVNSYNDGEETPGAGQLGPFYEIETSSPAAEIAPDTGIHHVHRTFHFTGKADALNALSTRILGVDLANLPFPDA